MAEKRYGLIGRTLGHSWSVPIHAALGRPEYQLFELEPEALAGFLRQEDLGGVNVTIPYKQTVMALCDEIDPTAREIGSVNTIVNENGRLMGYNTDADGFCVMADRAGVDFRGKKVVVLGSGGASQTVQAVAWRLGAREVVVISRSGEDNYQNLPRHANADIVINTTPVGMYPNVGDSPVDLTEFPICSGVLDLIYNPQRTELLMQAEGLCIPCSNGLPMLAAQAAAAEELFYGHVLPSESTERIIWDLRWRNTNIVLIGMPGSGKSTVGKILSGMTGREAVDIDAQVAHRAGRSIPEIFAQEGEAYFRQLEHEEIEKVSLSTGKIIICGGGVVTESANLPALRRNGRIYQLDRALESLSTEGRPLSQSRDLMELWEEREPLYWLFRDQLIDNNGLPEAAAEEIWRDFCENSGT